MFDVPESDNYETPIVVWRSLLPYVRDYTDVWDPFYCSGRSKVYWQDLGKVCHSEQRDAFTSSKPVESCCIVTNPPFSILEQCVTWILEQDCVAFVLLPSEVLAKEWFHDALKKTKRSFYLVPPTYALRGGFIKDGKQLPRPKFTYCIVKLCWGEL